MTKLGSYGFEFVAEGFNFPAASAVTEKLTEKTVL